MKSENLIKQWASYLTEGLKSCDEIIEDNAQLNTHKVKVEVSNIEWESYEGDDYDEDNEGGFPDCDCPTTVTLEIDVPNDANDDDLNGLIYNKLVDEIGDGWIPDYGNWNVDIMDPVQEDIGTSSSGKPNIIFCDIDGIIVDVASKDSDFENTQLNQDQYHIDPSAVEVLKDVCSKTNSKIVIDSAWTWIKNGEKTKMVGTTHKLRSRIPEIRKALGEFLFESEPLTPILTKEEIPGNENVNFDETGFPISANRKLKDGTVKTIPFNLSIMKPFCIAKWLDAHKNEIEKYVIIDNNTKSLKWGASKTNYNHEMTSALMDMNTSALVSTKGNAILDYFGVEKNDIEDTVDMEVSETDDESESKELMWYLFDKDGNVIAYSHDDVFSNFSSACSDAQKNVDKYPNIAYMEIRDRNDQK